MLYWHHQDLSPVAYVQCTYMLDAHALSSRFLCLQAFASFASALAADSAHLQTLTSCGRLYKSCGLLVESVESYRAAHNIDPSAPDVARALAVVLTDLGTLIV